MPSRKTSKPQAESRVAKYYAVLGLTSGATIQEISKAQRSLALREHPDKNGDEEKMKLINEAARELKAILEKKSDKNATEKSTTKPASKNTSSEVKRPAQSTPATPEPASKNTSSAVKRPAQSTPTTPKPASRNTSSEVRRPAQSTPTTPKPAPTPTITRFQNVEVTEMNIPRMPPSKPGQKAYYEVKHWAKPKA